MGFLESVCERAEERSRAQPKVAALSVVYLRDVNAGAGRVTETRSGTRESERVRRSSRGVTHMTASVIHNKIYHKTGSGRLQAQSERPDSRNTSFCPGHR